MIPILEAASLGTSEDRGWFTDDAFTGSPSPQSREEFWAAQRRHFGGGLTVHSVADDDGALKVEVRTPDGRQWAIVCAVEPDLPHRITSLIVSPTVFGFVARQATPDDAAALASVERDTPIVLDDRAISIDRGDDYFAGIRLMEQSSVAIGFLHGKPVAVFCGCVSSVRIGGAVTRRANGHRLRLLPELQGSAAWKMLAAPMFGNLGAFDGSIAYIAQDNAASQRTHINSPNKWSFPIQRALISTRDKGSSASYGRVAAPRDLSTLVEILNRCHRDEEGYLPYTNETLRQRLERAPDVYSWGDVRMTDDAVVAVWSDAYKVRVDAAKGVSEHRRSLVLDYGFLPGAEASLEALLRDSCARLSRRGLDQLAMFTTEGSPGYEAIAGLAADFETFDMWTYDVSEPADAASRGWYVDAINF